jgi:hypothetical protein
MSIDVSKILQPGNIAQPGGAQRALISDLQLLTPQAYNQYTEKYGNEAFFMWLATYAGMEEVKNRDFFWFESRGKLMVAVTNKDAVVAPAAGATVTVSIAAADYFTSTQTPLRAGETVRIASSDIEGEILAVNTTTPNAFTCTIRPKQSSQAFVSAGVANLLAGEVLIFGGATDVGEASDSIAPLVHLDIKYENSITELRETYTATDLAEMTEVFYNGGVSGTAGGAAQAGTSYFTYKQLVKTNQRFLNNMDSKLMRGKKVTNTGLAGSNSVGTDGFIKQISDRGVTVQYTPGALDIAKLHEITRVLDVNGGTKDALWLQDIYQRQQFSDGIFKEFPAGAWVWGSNENSQEARINYGVQSIMIDGYKFDVKKYMEFNTEFTTGKAPANDAYRNYGIICPMGSTRDSRGNTYKNITVMYQNPPKGGTIGNGIRVWQHGGGSLNPTNGKMIDNVEMIAYRGVRVVAANQFVQVVG